MLSAVKIVSILLLITKCTYARDSQDANKRKTTSGIFFVKADFVSPPTYAKFEDFTEEKEGKEENSISENSTFQREADKFKQSLEKLEESKDGRVDRKRDFHEVSSRQSERALQIMGAFLVFTVLCVTLNIWIKKVVTDPPTFVPTPAPSPWSSLVPSSYPSFSEGPSSSHRPHFDRTPTPSISLEPSITPDTPPSAQPSSKPSNFITNTEDFFCGMWLIASMFFTGFEMSESYTYQTQDGVKDYTF